MAGVLSAPRIIANVILTGMAIWPLCHIINSTSDAMWEREWTKKKFIKI
jgi:hypothetical protein